MTAASRLGPEGGLRPATYATIFGLIAATGLRRSEALHLRRSDVNLDGAFLTVRNTKFRKSRHVPIHATVVAKLRRADIDNAMAALSTYVGHVASAESSNNRKVSR